LIAARKSTPPDVVGDRTVTAVAQVPAWLSRTRRAPDIQSVARGRDESR
jgi:hypothetical protein